MEGRLDMATGKRLANRFKAEYAKGTKRQKGEVLDRLVAVAVGRSTARRPLSQAVKVREEPGQGAAGNRRVCVQLVVAGLVTMIFRVGGGDVLLDSGVLVL